MVISFKDQSIEARLGNISKERLSPSLIARRDLARWYWLIDDHEPLNLNHSEFQAVCSIVKASQLFEEPSRIKKLPFIIEDCLRSNSEIERFGIDVDSLCGKLRGASPIQLAGLVTRAEAYPSEKLWKRMDWAPNLIDTIIDGMHSALDAEYGHQIDKFLDKQNTGRWIIASDYSMGRPEFTHDAMAFVLIPYTTEMFPPVQIEQQLPLDFKDCKTTVDQSYIAYLRNTPTFSFVFLLDRSQKLFGNAELAEQAVQRSIEMMKGWPNAKEPQNAETIRKAELCLRESKTKSFLRKVNEVTLLSLLGAFVGSVAIRKNKLEGILWAPDRDNMSGVWEGLAASMFYANMHSILHRAKLPEGYIQGVAADGETVQKQWFDAYVRLADFLATPAAAMTRQQNGYGKFDKCNQIVKELFADNPRLVVQRLAFETKDNQILPDFRLIKLSKEPFEAV